MPFKSLAQLRKFAQLKKEGKIKQKTIDEWVGATDMKSLPKKAPPKPTGTIRGPRKSRRVRK